MTSQAVDERTLETLVGPLAQIFPQLERATILHSDELATERRTNPELIKTWFYTADSQLYAVEDGEVILYLGRGETNPIFNNIEEATQQLISTRNYIPPKEDVEAVKSAESTLRVKLSDLKLQGNDLLEHGFFEIGTSDYDSLSEHQRETGTPHYDGLNEHQRTVAERIYGQGEDFEQNMAMLRKNRVGIARVYVLNPGYVKQNIPQYGALARFSRLNGFDGDSAFFAYGRYGDSHNGLRGVRNAVAEDDPIVQAAQILLRDPRLAVQKMSPRIAAELSDITTTYFNQQKQ